MANNNCKRQFLLDFFIVGTQKGGTSALDFYLRMHEDIVMSRRKEIHFFDKDIYFQKESVDYSLLKAYYPSYTSNKSYGEATPIYMFWDDCLERIKAYNPDVKLIAVLRDPVTRAFSHWNMEVSRAKDDRSFSDAINAEKRQIESGSYQKHRVFSYLSRGLYSPQIDRMRSLFPERQLLFLKYEEFLRHQSAIAKDVIQFLGHETTEYRFQHKEVNKFQYVSRIDPDVESLLRDFFAQDVMEVEEKLRWDCSDWKKHSA